VQEENNVPPDTNDITLDSNDTINQIFDKILKRILLSLSKPSIIAFINGMFSETFPLDSNTAYHYTEHIDGNLKKTVADIIITLHNKDKVRRFHLEGQINDDNTIVIRVFQYGFADALNHQTTQGNRITLPFPTPAIIFLEHTESTPDEVILELDFGKIGKFNYPVQAMKFLAYNVEELCEMNMTILLPLYLLKLRREVENAKKRKTKKETTLRQLAKKLKNLIETSILPTIAENENAGNITHSDAFELLSLLDRLYDYLYGNIIEFKEEKVNIMLSDILELKYDARLAREVAIGVAREVAIEIAREVAKVEAGVEARVEAEHKMRLRDIARNFKDKGISITDIAEATGLTFAEIEMA